MHCYLPSLCFVPYSFFIILTGLLYSLVFGRLTGFYSVAAGMLFVVSGFFGLFAAGWRSYTSSLTFLFVLLAACVAAVGLNVAGVLVPDFVLLLDTAEDALVIGDFAIEPGFHWFGVALFFMVLVYIPILSIAICNACTVKKAILRKKRQRAKEEEKRKRKAGFLAFRGNTLRNRIRPEEFGKIREELNRAVRSTIPSSPVKEVSIPVD